MCGRIVKAPDSRLLTVESEGRIVACCQLEHRGAHAYFGMFAVSPALQGAGLGRTVIAKNGGAAERREGWGVAEMHMTVITARQDLDRLVRAPRLPPHRDGPPPFPYGDERFGIPQRDDLEFEAAGQESSPDRRTASGGSRGESGRCV
ncbi:Ribosomal protein S18 acetylase RimI-like enzyme OS=Streptomyces albaduncus OX=68172 GN=FHS32_002070 PE=4 SV=1 [Streptomyces griseoloalbus]